MKTMLSFSSVIVCLFALSLLVSMTGAQESEDDENREISEERIAAEKEMLEDKIAELEAKPLDYFGSQKNKRTRIVPFLRVQNLSIVSAWPEALSPSTHSGP